MSTTSKGSPRFNRFARYNLITLSILFFISFFWLYPFFWSFFSAFKTQAEMFSSGARLIPQQWEFSNIPRAWTEAQFNEYFFNTLLYSVTSTTIVLISTAMFGYVIARYRFPGRNIMYAVILSTLFIPIASIILPQFKLIQNLGLLNTRAGVILAMSGGGALYVLLFAGFFSTIPPELFEAAKMDGASFWQTFRVALPLARPIIGTVAIFQFLSSWNEFNIPLVFTLSRPELRTLAVGMFAFQGEYSFDWPGFAAGTLISIVPVLIVFLIFQNQFVNGLQGAVKQ